MLGMYRKEAAVVLNSIAERPWGRALTLLWTALAMKPPARACYSRECCSNYERTKSRTKSIVSRSAMISSVRARGQKGVLFDTRGGFGDSVRYACLAWAEAGTITRMLPSLQLVLNI
jgi:hypothetical protein